MKKLLATTLFSAAALLPFSVQAATYDIDNEGAHASINFKIQHLGYSWLTGRFNDFEEVNPVLLKVAVGYFLTSRKSEPFRCLSRSAWFESRLVVSMTTSIDEASGDALSYSKLPSKSLKRPVSQL